MKFALETEKACDLIGLGRPSIIEPAVPKEKLLNPNVYDEDAHIKLRDFGKNRLGELLGVKSLGVGIENVSSTSMSGQFDSELNGQGLVRQCDAEIGYDGQTCGLGISSSWIKHCRFSPSFTSCVMCNVIMSVTVYLYICVCSTCEKMLGC